MPSHEFTLSRDAFGKLVFRGLDGAVHEGVAAVRAFPIAAPEEGIALVSADGRELAWIEKLADLVPSTRELVEAELAAREFMPQIRRLIGVSSFATPSTWRVETDRGNTQFVLRGEEDIHRLSQQTLLVVDSHGIQFLIRDLFALDAGSRRLLDRFL
jgi:hypothetical protein